MNQPSEPEVLGEFRLPGDRHLQVRSGTRPETFELLQIWPELERPKVARVRRLHSGRLRARFPRSWSEGDRNHATGAVRQLLAYRRAKATGSDDTSEGD